MSWKNEYFLKKKAKREIASGERVRCEYFYDTNDEYVSGVWAQSIACSVLSSQQFGERYLEELCNQKYQRKIFLCQNYWVQYCQHTKDCFKEILGLPYLLCIFFTNNVINNNCGFSSNWILPYFPTVHSCVRHRRDISHFSHI